MTAPAPATRSSATSIHSNSGLGIDLGATRRRPTPNDPGDSDTGPNNLQNSRCSAARRPTERPSPYPERSTSPGGAPNYRIEFFANGVGRPALPRRPPPGPLHQRRGQRHLLREPERRSSRSARPSPRPRANLTTSSSSELSAGVTATAGFFDLRDGLPRRRRRCHGPRRRREVCSATPPTRRRLHLDDGDLAIDSGDSFISAVSTTAAGTPTASTISLPATTTSSSIRVLLSPDVNVWADKIYAVAGAAKRGRLHAPRPARSTAAVNVYAVGQRRRIDQHRRARDQGRARGRQRQTASTPGFSFNAIVNDRGDAADEDGAVGRAPAPGQACGSSFKTPTPLSRPQTANFSINFAGGGGPQTIDVTGHRVALPSLGAGRSRRRGHARRASPAPRSSS